MEISLNLLWLGVALIAIGIWVFRWRSASAAWISGAVALGCALVLLFPSISVTDDLHPQIVAVDAANGKRSSMCSLISCTGRGLSHNSVTAQKLPGHPFLALLSNLSAGGAFTISGIVTEKASQYTQTSSTSVSGRSPPVFYFC